MKIENYKNQDILMSINVKLKKGQATLFIIVSILIIVIILIYFYKNKISNNIMDDAEYSIELKAQSEIIQNYVDKCVYDNALKAVYILGAQGGYIDPEISRLKSGERVKWERSGYLKIPYWYNNLADNSPSLAEMEENLENYLDSKIILNCMNFSDVVSLDGTKIRFPEYIDEELGTHAVIGESRVSIVFEHPIFLSIGNSQKEIRVFSAELDLPLGKNFAIGKKIISKAIDNKDYFNMADHCFEVGALGYIKSYYSSGKIVINDYSTYYDPRYERTLTFQYRYEDLAVVGEC